MYVVLLKTQCMQCKLTAAPLALIPLYSNFSEVRSTGVFSDHVNLSDWFVQSVMEMVSAVDVGAGDSVNPTYTNDIAWRVELAHHLSTPV